MERMVNAEHDRNLQRTQRYSKRLSPEEKTISKIERMLDRSGIQPILKMQESLEPYYRAFEQTYSIVSLREESLPATLHFALGRQQEKVISDLERSLEAFRRYLLSIPSPNFLTPLELQAREAWLRFDEGDPEPLDVFIKKRLGIMANHDGPLPDDLRQRVFEFLDCCFAPPPAHCQSTARKPPTHHAQCRTHVPQSIACRCAPRRNSLLVAPRSRQKLVNVVV
jgi:hypothetical protein